MEIDPNAPQAPNPGAKLPAIPTPMAVRWREFRISFVPILTFGLALLLIIYLWREMPPAAAVRGIGEGAVSLLTSPQDGFVQEMLVQPHQWVEAGQPLARVVPFDPQSNLDMFQSQLQISRLALEPSVADRNAVNYEQLRLDSMRLKQELAMAQVNLDRAEKILPRHQALVNERLLSQDVFDLSVRDRDFYQAEVREKAKAIEEIDARLEELKTMGEPVTFGVNPAAGQIIPKLEAAMAAMQTNWNPITIVAPISGQVIFHRQQREFVVAGEPLLTVNADRADRVIAYLKQPLPFDPEVGMAMEVITRSAKPIRFTTQISQIGARVEVITNAIAFVAVGAIVDSGLPLILPVPQGVQIRPGEVVDVRLAPEEPTGRLTDRLFGAAN